LTTARSSTFGLTTRRLRRLLRRATARCCRTTTSGTSTICRRSGRNSTRTSRMRASTTLRSKRWCWGGRLACGVRPWTRQTSWRQSGRALPLSLVNLIARASDGSRAPVVSSRRCRCGRLLPSPRGVPLLPQPPQHQRRARRKPRCARSATATRQLLQTMKGALKVHGLSLFFTTPHNKHGFKRTEETSKSTAAAPAEASSLASSAAAALFGLAPQCKR
jgi:hypothetical protein